MDQPPRPLDHFPPKPGPVPVVEAGDLEAVWSLQNDMQARFPGQCISIDARSYQRALRPDADVVSVWYRLSIFAVLQLMSKTGGLQLPWLTDGKPSQAVFAAFAKVSMTALAVGKPTNQLPVDLDELARLIQKEST
jgi:hypothetical protein